jgi:hypothetical protein
VVLLTREGKERALMREILGERRTNGTGDRRPALREAALDCAQRWRWPVVPGVEALPDGTCGCPRPDCVVPGGHPAGHGLLAATHDPRMIRWWWTARPAAPVLLATGGRAPCALSLPAVAGARALAELDRRRLPAGGVIAAPTRWLLLVRPYEYPELGELLADRDRVPSSLRFHGPGGYVPLPPTVTGSGPVCWARRPRTGRDGTPDLPATADVLDVMVEAGLSAPDPGSRLAY